MFIYREDAEDPTGEKNGTAELIIAKHRNGSTGTVEVAFSPQFTKFDNLYQE
jgi:replicative DNA helicase